MKLLPSPLQEYLLRLYKHAETEDHQLLYLFLEITRKCNLLCKHCGSDCTSQSSKKELSTIQWLRILDFIHSNFTVKPVINLTGGEPILHQDFNLIIEHLHQLKYKWGVVSNGFALDISTIDTLTKYNISSITISLDGTEDNHNWLRGNSGSFKRALSAIKLLSQKNIPFRDVVTCVNPKNIVELDSIAELLLDCGIHSWRLFRIFPAGRASNNSELLLSQDQTRTMLDWIKHNKKHLSRRGLDINLSCEGWIPMSKNHFYRNHPFICRAGINIASILNDGTITGCSNNSSLFFEGNICNDNFLDIWEHGFIKHRKRTWLTNSECSKCSYVKNCQGGSIHLWRENFNRPEFCYVDCI